MQCNETTAEEGWELRSLLTQSYLLKSQLIEVTLFVLESYL